MFTLYLLSVLVGGGLLLYSIFGGGGDDAAPDAEAYNPAEWLSLRSLTYFLFVFGGLGAVLSRTWPAAAAPVVLLLSVLGGVAVGTTVSAAFRYLRRTESGERQSDESFVGQPGRMTLPIGAGGTGKVLVGRGDRTFELLARPLDGAAGDPASWTSVVVVEMNHGFAFVAPEDHPAARELTSLNP